MNPTFTTLENFGHSLKLSARHLWLFMLTVVVILSSCQTPPKRDIEIENKESPILQMLIEPDDLPKWSESMTTVNQPSKVEWLHQENLSDSAASYLRGNYSVGFKRYYILIHHNVAQYSRPVAEMESLSLNPLFENSQEIASIKLQEFGDTMAYKCFDSEIFSDCTVTVRYAYIESYVKIIFEKGFGTSEMETLLNAILSIINSKITGS